MKIVGKVWLVVLLGVMIAATCSVSLVYAQYYGDLREEVLQGLTEGDGRYTEGDGYTTWIKKKDGTIIKYFMGTDIVQREYTVTGKKTVYERDGTIILEATESSQKVYDESGKLDTTLEGDVVKRYADGKLLYTQSEDGVTSGFIRAEKEGYEYETEIAEGVVYIRYTAKGVQEMLVERRDDVYIYEPQKKTEQILVDGEVVWEKVDGKRTKGSIFKSISVWFSKLFNSTPTTGEMEELAEAFMGSM